MPTTTFQQPTPQQIVLPQSDPLADQMLELMKFQEAETQKLKQTLESLGGVGPAGNMGSLDQIIENTTKELESLKDRLHSNNNNINNKMADD